jgi:hypothetical protein
MATHFYCWEPSLWFNPLHPDPISQLNAHYDLMRPVKPSSKLLAFVSSLLSNSPGVSKSREDIICAAMPLQGDIIGKFVDLTVSWYYYE